MPAYDAMAKTAKVGIRFGGHVPDDVGLLHAMEMGQETFDHIDGYIEQLDGRAKPVDDKALQDLVQRTKKAGAGSCRRWWSGRRCRDRSRSNRAPDGPNCATCRQRRSSSGPRARLAPEEPAIQRRAGEAAHRQSHEDPEGAARRRRWRAARQRRPAAVQRARFLDPPRDAADGRRRHQRYEIVKSGTANVGQYFKGQDTFGTIAVGQRADLILVDANPLQNVSNMEKRSGVMVRGRWLPASEIDARLAKIAASK